MGRVILLKFEGDLEESGFRVTLEIRSETNQIEIEEWGQLPPNPDLVDSLKDWREKYRDVGAPARIKPKRIIYDGNIQERKTECKEASIALRDRFTSWLKSDSFRSIDRQLREELHRDEEVRLLLRGADQSLKKLPWQEWDFVQRYPNIEVVFTSLQKKRPKLPSVSDLLPKNRILAILGHADGINVDADRKLLEGLRNSEVTFLVEPQRQELGDRLWEQSWDVIFFAGHSETEGETGRIYLNPTDSLTIEELWFSLRKAVDRGLKLAIFNSCDGLGLVQQLDDLAIPHLIVMRELVPDKVAQEFLKYLLAALAEDKPVHLAVREARERLETLQDQYPCAPWLPIIIQPEDYTILPRIAACPGGLCRRFLVSLGVTMLVMGVRWIGLLQSAELQAYDHLMRSRLTEQPDSRLLMVSIDEEDIRQYGYPIPDDTLATALEKLRQEKPITIGVNITRDLPVPAGKEGYAKFANLLKQPNPQLITVCSLPDSSSQDKESINPPPDAPPKQVGFDNVYDDFQWKNRDHTIRRQILSRSENTGSSFSKCNTPYAFTFLLTIKYLNAKQLPAEVNQHQDWELGKVLFERLNSYSGGYQNLDARGNQVLINYRNTPQIAQSVSLKAVLNGQYHPTWVANKIVLVGMTASSVDPGQDTPLGRLPKLHVQAQMLSSILSAIDRERPLIRWLSVWADALWIACWSVLGVGLVMAWRSRPRWLWLASSLAWGILYGLCWAFLMVGVWLPLIPATIALFMAEGFTAYWLARPTKK